MSKRQETEEESIRASGLSRRQFLRGVGAVGAGSALVTELLAPEEAVAEPMPLAQPPAGTTLHKGRQAITLQVNGQAMTMQVEPRTTLLNALRNHADPPVTGPKLICDQGACGGCTVILDGKTVYGCMQLAVDAIGKQIRTVEGLIGPNGELSPVQEAFVNRDALMCGFCTPGFVLSATALLKSNPSPTHEEIQKGCAGNLCRCGTYPHIFEAVAEAAQKMRGGA